MVSTFAGGSPPPLPNAAFSLSLGNPSRVAIDPAGNIYFGSAWMIWKLDRSGMLTVVAGSSRPGCSGDGGPARSAQVTQPAGIAFDSRGNMYFADTGCDVVRKIDSSGAITLVAGAEGLAGNSGDKGPANAARLNAPVGIAFDAAGNLYIADSANYAVRRVLASDGSISIFAGTGVPGASADNVPATQSGLGTPVDVAFDSDGNLYIADRTALVVRMVDPKGVISTFAGTGQPGAIADSPVPTRSPLQSPSGVAWDPRSRSVYIADLSSIRAVSETGIKTIAGGGSFFASPLTNGQSALGARMNPGNVAIDPSGNLIVAPGDSRIWRITPDGIATAIAGNGLPAYTGDGGPAIGAQLQPTCVALDNAHNVYVADRTDNVVRKISSGGAISTIAGTGKAGNSGDNGPATKAQLTPSCVAADRNGNLYIADASHSVVRKVSASDNSISTVAGTGVLGIAGDDGPAVGAQLISPASVAVDLSGNLYIGDVGTCAIRKVGTDGIIHTIAGRLTQAQQTISTACSNFASGDGIAATAANLNFPVSLAADTQNNVWFIDQGYAATSAGTTSDYIRKITPDGAIHMIAGQGSNSGDNIAASSAALRGGTTIGLTADGSGNVFFTDGKRVRKVDTKGILSTVAGDGKQGYSGDGGAALQAEFWSLSGLALDSSGNIYLADEAAGAIRLLQPGTPPANTGPSISAVTNAASNQQGPVSPGEIVTIYGSGLGPSVTPPLTSAPDANGVYPTTLSGTRVLFNNIPAPLIYTSATQVAAVVPYAVSGANVPVAVEYQNTTGTATTVPVAASNPAIFTFGSGTGQAAAVNQDGSLNGASAPAPIGSVIILFATGEGATSPAGIDGTLTGTSLPKPVLPVTVTIGGIAANILYAGEAPQEIAGVMQLNVMVPTGVTPGNSVAVAVKVGDNVSPAGVTIAVSGN